MIGDEIDFSDYQNDVSGNLRDVENDVYSLSNHLGEGSKFLREE